MTSTTEVPAVVSEVPVRVLVLPRTLTVEEEESAPTKDVPVRVEREPIRLSRIFELWVPDT